MNDASNFRALRLTASLVATAASILLCSTLKHFTPSLTDPGSFLLATHHRCGWALIATSLWAALESLTYLNLPVQNSTSV